MSVECWITLTSEVGQAVPAGLVVPDVYVYLGTAPR